MTTSFTPEPRPGNPAAASTNPAVESNTATATAAQANPDNKQQADAAKPEAAPDGATSKDERDEKTADGGDQASTEGNSSDSENATDGKESGPAEGDGDTTEDPETYTTTEPGFPIGELIAALVQPGISAAMMLPSMAMSLPSTAMGLAGPLLSSLIALLGQAGHPPAAPAQSAPPPPPAESPVKNSQGAGPDAYRDAAEKTEAKEGAVREKDENTEKAVTQGHVVQAQARGDMHAITTQLELAIRRTPPGPEGRAAVTQQIRASISDARDVVLRTQDAYTQVAGQLVRV
ncbi:hypothetical protein A5768_11165 [Mycolicibacterium fortuitum]|uniref:hypothetical protein n=1 Tax=Mycolicibacterium fortuitum TaxID=1766 RepID=UPI0007E99271|nr:hypothetical protein [Mycolicibacterium fortuitum]OBG12278.1 hypothetical protein A5768_11165 [Mycolicibacterium fortuitum]